MDTSGTQEDAEWEEANIRQLVTIGRMLWAENGRMSTTIARDMLKTGQLGFFSCVTHIRHCYARYDSVEWVAEKTNARAEHDRSGGRDRWLGQVVQICT
jgi:hypothetical protein